MSKRLLTVVLTLVFVLALAVPASANAPSCEDKLGKDKCDDGYELVEDNGGGRR